MKHAVEMDFGAMTHIPSLIQIQSFDSLNGRPVHNRKSCMYLHRTEPKKTSQAGLKPDIAVLTLSNAI
jgi:hypothetical protein